MKLPRRENRIKKKKERKTKWGWKDGVLKYDYRVNLGLISEGSINREKVQDESDRQRGVYIYITPIMDIVKAFNENDLHTEIIIKGTVNDPLFRASDIGVVLELSNIRMSIADFDESEKVVSTTDTLGGTQEVTF